MSTDYFIGVNEFGGRIASGRSTKPGGHETELLWKDAGFVSCRSISTLGAGWVYEAWTLAQVVGPSGEVCAVDRRTATATI
jgi:hypothetical protein